MNFDLPGSRNTDSVTPMETPNVVKIRCAYSSLVDPTALRPNPKNPNRHPAKQIELFTKILAYNGIRRAVVVSNRSKFVTKGHGLLEAALAMGLSSVPVDYQDYDSDEQELADVLADNQLAEWAEIDQAALNGILLELNTGSLDLEVTGFDQAWLEKRLAEFASATPDLTFPDAEPGIPPGPSNLGDEPAVSHVRMVQLYLSDATLPEFETMALALQKRYSQDNVTDTVMAALREVYGLLPQEQTPDAPAPEAGPT